MTLIPTRRAKHSPFNEKMWVKIVCRLLDFNIVDTELLLQNNYYKIPATKDLLQRTCYKISATRRSISSSTSQIIAS